MNLKPDMDIAEVMQTISVLRQWAARRNMRLQPFFEVSEALATEGLEFGPPHAIEAIAASRADQAALDKTLGGGD